MNGPAHPSYATIDGRPTPVADLTVSAVTDTSVTLSFTEVDDGAGNPASYDVRYALTPISWGSAPSVARGNCAVPVSGSAIGARRSCTVVGLAPASSYQFQLIAFRGTLNVNAVFGALSNVASGATAGAAPASAAVLVQEGFEDASFALRGWYDNTGMATTAAQQVSGSRALEVHFLVGGRTPTWGGAASLQGDRVGLLELLGEIQRQLGRLGALVSSARVPVSDERKRRLLRALVHASHGVRRAQLPERRNSGLAAAGRRERRSEQDRRGPLQRDRESRGSGLQRQYRRICDELLRPGRRQLYEREDIQRRSAVVHAQPRARLQG